MESTSTLLVPLTRAARHLADSAQRAFASSAQALRAQRDELPHTDLARATAQFLEAAEDTIGAARTAAKPYRRQAARALASTQDRIESLGKLLDAGKHRLASAHMRRSNVIARHPYATTFVVVGVGFIAWRQWRRLRTARERDSVTEIASAGDRPSERTGAEAETGSSPDDARRDGQEHDT